MELRDALRMLRSEIGLTQSELADAVHVGYTAASRWENKNTRPNRASSLALLALAQRHSVSAVCLDALNSILLASRADDKEDKALLEQVTNQMKLEERVLLTVEQMKTTIDKLDLAVLVQRIFSASDGKLAVIYHNRRYAEIFGYSQDEFDRKSRENVYFALPPESRESFLQRLTLLLAGEQPLADFTMTLRAFKKNGAELWLELKAIDLRKYSYGHELCLSCRDVTANIEAERKYAEEVALRDAYSRCVFASFHCDLTANVIFRQRDLAALTGVKTPPVTADAALAAVAKTIPGGVARSAYTEQFNCSALLAAFRQNDVSGSSTQYNLIARRWLRYEYALLKNSYNGHAEAVLYVYDAQQQVLAEKMLGIVSNQFFDYIGLIDTVTETVESYYTSEKALGQAVTGQRSYAALCEEKLGRFAEPGEAGAERQAIALPHVRQRLSKNTFYSTVLHLQAPDGRHLYKKITYTYLDDTCQTIIVAQADMNELRQFVEYHKAQLASEAQK